MREVEQYIYDNWDKVIRENRADDGTLIGLPFPYTVPCAEGTFQELYYWDTYFTNVGLILSGRTNLAKNNVDNMLFLIERYGFMPNGSRTFYQYRSQPPFLSEMVKDIFDKTGDTAWLAEAYATLTREYAFWQKDRLTDTGLNRYYGQLTSFADNADAICERLGIPLPTDAAEKERLGESAYSTYESGWDCTSRFALYAQDIVPVDLNALLYGMEKNMARFSRILGNGDEGRWSQRAEQRRARMNAVLWDDGVGGFCDYDFRNKEKRTLASTAMFYPLFFGAADDRQTAKTVGLLPRLEFPYGLAGCEDREDVMGLQWDYPNGWACQQYMVIRALDERGYRVDAVRLARKYVALVEKVFRQTGSLWEKYNVTDGTVSVNKEYETPTMMGWSAGVYLYCLKIAG